jgi:pyruvate dehydrogenase E2 component (dihydrolipoamide acetyltransferase)
MAIKVLMPALSPTMTEGSLTKWLKQEGDKIAPGQVIAEIETDKAVMEVESADSGILAKILVSAGAQGVKVNQLIAVLLEPGEGPEAAEKLIEAHSSASCNTSANVASHPKQDVEVKVDVQSVQPESVHTQATSPSKGVSQRVIATPLAKRLASDRGVPLHAIAGSGPRGRIVKADVLAFATSGGVAKVRSAVEVQLVPLTQISNTLASRLQESKLNAPHFYLTIQCDMSQLMAAREYINGKSKLIDGKAEYKISVNDFMIKATAMALAKHPNVNAGWSDEGIVMYNNVDISVAVATDAGLITPIVQNADHKSLQQISNEEKSLAHKARNNQLKPHEFIGGSFTISNLGMYGVDEFCAIINPPQAGILAIGGMQKTPVVKDGAIVVADVAKITLSCDHRVVDGAVAGQFIADLRAHIEQPFTMFL